MVAVGGDTCGISFHILKCVVNHYQHLLHDLLMQSRNVSVDAICPSQQVNHAVGSLQLSASFRSFKDPLCHTRVAASPHLALSGAACSVGTGHTFLVGFLLQLHVECPAGRPVSQGYSMLDEFCCHQGRTALQHMQLDPTEVLSKLVRPAMGGTLPWPLPPDVSGYAVSDLSGCPPPRMLSAIMHCAASLSSDRPI